MSILEWFPLLNESALAQNLSHSQNPSSYLLLAYFLVSVVIKRAAYLAAFFMSCLLFEMRLFDPLSESSLYLLTFAIYSYVVSCNALTLKQRIACGIILILSITLAYDAYHYGTDGIYGTHETILYRNIEHLALYAHLIFIGSLIPYRRVGYSLRRYIDSFMLIARNSANFVWL